MKKLTSRLAPLALAGLLTAALAGPAAAETPSVRGGAPGPHPCDWTAADANEERWDISGANGSVRYGTDGGSYYGYGQSYLETANNGDGYDNSTGECSFDDEAGRELVLGVDELYPFPSSSGNLRGPSGPMLQMQRKVYVPASGPAFARFLTIIRNPSSAPLTVDYGWYGRYNCLNDVVATTDGDANVQTGESGAVVENCEGPSVTSLWNMPGSDTWDRSHDRPGDSDYANLVWRNVTVPANGTVTFMHVEHQSSSGSEEAIEFLRQNGHGPEAFYAGMSEEELASLRNWRNLVPPADTDGDGVPDASDNCVAVPNADQADLDRDGRGDVCDDDVDGDGLSDAIEAGLGTNPRHGDSDGDGRPDASDLCPTLAGTVNGCPAPVATVAAARSRPVPTDVSLNATARRAKIASARGKKARGSQAQGVTVRTSGRIGLPAGVPAAACADGKVAVVVKRGTRTISSRVVPVAADCTYRSTVRFSRRLGRTVRVQAHFFGSQGLEARTAAPKKVSIK